MEMLKTKKTYYIATIPINVYKLFRIGTLLSFYFGALSSMLVSKTFPPKACHFDDKSLWDLEFFLGP